MLGHVIRLIRTGPKGYSYRYAGMVRGDIESVDLAQQAQELLGAVARLHVADDEAALHVERCEQRRRAVALLVVGNRRGAPTLHRQTRLGAVSC